MLDRIFTEPRHRQSDIRFDRARVIVRIEPAEGPTIEVEVPQTMNGSMRFDYEDMELRDTSKVGYEFSEPLSVLPMRRQVILSMNALGDESGTYARVREARR